MTTSMVFTLEIYRALGVAYRAALARKDDVFTFESHEFNTAYAGYLLEYLSQKFGPLTC